MRHGRSVLVALTALVASGCGGSLPGAPVPAAGFLPTEDTANTSARPTSATNSVASSAAPAIPTARRLAGVDLCSLVTGDDLTTLGGLAGVPAPRPDVFPESCAFPLGAGAAGDVVLIAFYKPYDQVRDQQPGGHEEFTLGHSTWVDCATPDGYQTCTAAVAARRDRSVVVVVSRRDTPSTKVISLLQPLTATVVGRLTPE